VVYTVEANEVLILAVVHQHRKPDYGRNRISRQQASVGRGADLIELDAVRNPSGWPASTANKSLYMQRDPHAFLCDVR
jgi:hypothetical protein